MPTDQIEPNHDHDSRELAAQEKALDEALEILRGRFDGLVIIGTWTLEDGSSATLQRNDGNWYCQNGLVDYLYRRRVANAQLDTTQQRDNEQE